MSLSIFGYVQGIRINKRAAVRKLFALDQSLDFLTINGCLKVDEGLFGINRNPVFWKPIVHRLDKPSTMLGIDRD